MESNPPQGKPWNWKIYNYFQYLWCMDELAAETKSCVWSIGKKTSHILMESNLLQGQLWNWKRDNYFQHYWCMDELAAETENCLCSIDKKKKHTTIWLAATCQRLERNIIQVQLIISHCLDFSFWVTLHWSWIWINYLATYMADILQLPVLNYFLTSCPELLPVRKF